MGVHTPSRVEFDEEVAGRLDEYDETYDGWFCVRTAAWPCPAEGCTFVANFITAAHYIVVWPSIDDRALFAQARNAREAGRKPMIVAYEQSFGPSIPFDVWLRLGRPVHGQVKPPEGWADRTGSRL